MTGWTGWIKTIAGVIGAFLGGFLGGMDGALYALIAFMVVDYITGVIIAIVDHTLSSKIGARGIFKKIVMLMIVGIANMLDQHIIRGGSTALRTAVIFFYIANEGISIIENAALLGLPIPQKLKDVLLQLKDDGENGE